MDKFTLASNPLRPESSGVFIVHMLDPVAIIECTSGESPPSPAIISKTFHLNGSSWTFSIFFIDHSSSKAEQIFDRAWRWYRSIIEKRK